eukprot:3310865-Rhodomonas_salina.2
MSTQQHTQAPSAAVGLGAWATQHAQWTFNRGRASLPYQTARTAQQGRAAADPPHTPTVAH